MNGLRTFVGVLAFASFAAAAFAQTSAEAGGEFSLQGRLTTTSGSPVVDGEHRLSLKVYAKGTSNLVYEEMDNVITSNGIFSTTVGDNGTGGAVLNVGARSEYELGVSVDAEQEMSPRLRLGRVLRAAVADVAADARAVGGFTVDSSGTGAHAVVVTDAHGRLNASLIGNSAVTSVNGLRGNVNIQLTGSGVSMDTTGGMLHLNISGGGGGGFSLPFVSSQLALGTGDAFSITNTLNGSSGAFVNLGAGSALRATANTGTAIHATSSGSLSGAATIKAENNAGVAIDAVGTTSTDAVVRIRNNAAVGGRLISALNAGGNAAFEVAASGRTTINSTVDNALEVTATTAGDAALKLNGGFVLNGPCGTGTLDLGVGSVVVNNAHARANSLIMLTITSVTGVTTAVPIRVSAQGAGTFTVAAVANGLGSLAGNYSFNYLIINQ